MESTNSLPGAAKSLCHTAGPEGALDETFRQGIWWRGMDVNEGLAGLQAAARPISGPSTWAEGIWHEGAAPPEVLASEDLIVMEALPEATKGCQVPVGQGQGTTGGRR